MRPSNSIWLNDSDNFENNNKNQRACLGNKNWNLFICFKFRSKNFILHTAGLIFVKGLGAYVCIHTDAV